MNDLIDHKPKRKLLSLKLQDDAPAVRGITPPQFLHDATSFYMVWCPEGDMPKRVYKPDEKAIAVSHAKTLADETGKRFFVMRTWRGFDPA